MSLNMILYVLVVVTVVHLAVALSRTLSSPLRSVPGPFLARFTNLYYFARVWNGHFEKENIELHRKYGPIVRLGPQTYSIDSPAAAKIIYSAGSKFAKSAWYDVFKNPSPNEWTLFPLRDMKQHADERRKFQAIYSLSSLVDYEPCVDHCTAIFFARLTEMVAAGQAVDIGHWLQCYAFDVIAYLSFSKRFGFLDKGEDIGGLIRSLEGVLRYGALMGIYAWLHPLIYKITSTFRTSSSGSRAMIANFVKSQIQEWQRRSETKTMESEIEVREPQNIIQKLLNAHKVDPQRITEHHVFKAGLFNITAGSDTTSVTLSAILYYLLKNPAKLRKLRAEIKTFNAQGLISESATSFKVTQTMPYLQAVIKESMRVHPATGLPLWRVVPEEGAEICGQVFPAGTVVGINTWSAHYNDSVFENAHEFIPERWIDDRPGQGEKIKRMDSYFFPFGLGARTCLGKHISNLEISKLLPRLLGNFDFELEDPDKDWNTLDYWFVKPHGFRVKVRVCSDHGVSGALDSAA